MLRKVSTGRILKNDYPSLLMLICIGVIWVAAIGGGIFGFLPKRRGGGTVEVDSTMMMILIVVAVIVTLMLGWLAAKRIDDIKRVIRVGPEVKGHIQSITFFKDRGRVEYEYQHKGQTYQSGNAIWKNRKTTRLQNGDEITLIVDPKNPSRAFIASLYS